MTSPDNGPVVLERETQRTQSLFPINVAFADYDRTRPLIDGRVKPKGISLTANTSWIGDFCTRPVYEDYDAAEMSFSWYVAARDRVAGRGDREPHGAVGPARLGKGGNALARRRAAAGPAPVR